MPELDPVVHRQLANLDIAHEVVECDPGFADTEAFCAQYGVPKQNAVNAIIVAVKTDPKSYVACAVLASTKIDVNHKLSKILGIKRLSFASAEETKALTDQLIGGVTLFGLPESLPVYIDRAIMDADYVLVGGGNRSTKIRLLPAELLKLPTARVEDIATPRT